MMNHVLVAAVSFFLFMIPATLPAHAVEMKTVLRLQGATDLDHDEAHEDHWDSRDQLELAADGQAGEAITYKASGRLTGDFYGNGGAEDDIDLDLYDTYVQYSSENFDLKVGNLVVQWGKMDEVVLTDNVNAQDLDQLFLPWKEDRKLAAPMAQAEIYMGQSTLELIISPRPYVDRIKFFGSDWALFRHNREVGADLASDAATANFFDDLGVTADAPGWGDVEYGGRLRSTVGEVDFALSALVHHQRTPVLRGDLVALAAAFDPKTALATLPADPAQRALVLATASPDITASYPWVVTLGGAMETTVGDYGVRAEVAHTLNAEYQASDLGVVEADQTLLGIGADVTIDAFYGNVQAIQQWVQESQSLLLTRQQAVTLVLVLEYETLQGTLTPALYTAWDLGDNAAYLRPRLQYKATDQLTLDLGLHVITGDDDTTLGQFDANDQVYLLATLSF